MAMEKTAKLLAAAVMVVAVMAAVVEGQSANCTTELLSLQPCLPYLQAGNTSTPDVSCCTPLNAVFTSSSGPACLCSFISQLNISRAAELAISCNSTVPESVVSCALAPSSAPSSSPPPPSVPSAPGSSPSKTGGNSTGSNNQTGNGFAVWPTRNIVMWALVVGVGGMLV